jgi:hypothetical protein
MRKLLCATALVWAISNWTASAAVITGPTLPLDVGAHFDHGIQFTALTNSTLTGFVYNYQGAADLVELTTPLHTMVLDTLPIPATGIDPSTFTASVSWALTAGNTYWLLGTTMANGRYTSFAGFPVTDSDISVTAGIFSDQMPPDWGDFTNITTGARAPGSGVPEPDTATLLMAASLLTAAWRSRAPKGVAS